MRHGLANKMLHRYVILYAVGIVNSSSANRVGDDIGVVAVRADASEIAQCHV